MLKGLELKSKRLARVKAQHVPSLANKKAWVRQNQMSTAQADIHEALHLIDLMTSVQRLGFIGFICVVLARFLLKSSLRAEIAQSWTF